ncbi:diaminopimelate epimerase [Limnohabitans sp. JirII-29]|uniref:diaminopimelate epimerase n=1 Tax=Limnohabitans sp. JirII-29 TaxID=1835756 RepID=UPI000D34C106|nr:diaminopimelate epimerase [Limnohabitans sp. JirII-29]PUE29268.1 diaminopimelate epimerase [Limnohabitans sp. JirII-29]
MRIRFTKMQGAGNDFVVLDETRERLNLSSAHYRFLADRHFGVGADQILSVRPAPQPDVDFEYVIHNADGGEVEQCGNGSRCFVRFVREQGLTDKTSVRVKVHGGVIELHQLPNGQVTVDMGAPVFEVQQVPFDPLHANALHDDSPTSTHAQTWQLALSNGDSVGVGVVSMGNPHAVQVVENVDTAPVLTQGPLIEHHAAFPRRVNAGFMQIVNRSTIRLRVFERGAGETLACGTGACAAVVTGIRWGLLDPEVLVHTHGGDLTIAWAGGGHPVYMTGPATTVFHGEINLPDTL